MHRAPPSFSSHISFKNLNAMQFQMRKSFYFCKSLHAYVTFFSIIELAEIFPNLVCSSCVVDERVVISHMRVCVFFVLIVALQGEKQRYVYM